MLRLSGFVGVDPRPFTFRELFIMAEGRRAEEWCYWSEILALTANCHRDPKKGSPVRADAIHPYRRKNQRQGSITDTINAVKAKSRFGGIKREAKQNG